MLLRALQSRAFRLVWAGQTVSRLGDAVYVVAIAWWVVQFTGSATAMGFVLVIEVAPTLLFLLVGGIVVDRLPRLWVMVGADLLRAAVLLMVAFLAAAGRLELSHVLVATAIFGSVSAFFYPAFVAVIPDITPIEYLPSANSLTQISARFAGIFGPGLGAAVVATWGSSGAFALDALTFLASGFSVLVVAGWSPGNRRGQSHERALGQLKEGFLAVASTPWLWVTIAVAGASTVTMAGPLEAALPFLVSRDLRAGVEVFGLLGSVAAMGAIIAGIWLGRRSKLRHRGPLLYGAWLLAATMVTAMGLPIGLPAVALAMTVAGSALAVVGLVWTNSLQELVPKQLRGRVASIDALGSSSLLPLGFAATGLATDRIGASGVFVIGGILSFVLIGGGLLHPQIRNLD